MDRLTNPSEVFSKAGRFKKAFITMTRSPDFQHPKLNGKPFLSPLQKTLSLHG